MIILGIETSCDETSAGVVVDGIVKSNIISSQLIHQQYGGVVPELASRAHQRMIIPIVKEALNTAGIEKNQVDGVAVTHGPGLIGALLVGVNFAKSFAYSLGIPFIGINHLEAHIYSNFLEEPKPNYPFLVLLVSGGHTQLVLVREQLKHQLLGETRDDAAGEAYDKVAKMLGLEFPGGPIIERLAQKGNPNFVKFPRSYLDSESFDFSFSGIKTSVLYWLRDHNYYNSPNKSQMSETLIADLCASFQSAIIDVLVNKTLQAAKRFDLKHIAISGGVSANSELRRRLKEECQKFGISMYYPRLEYCTDNGAMIAYLGWMKMKAGLRSELDLNAIPNLSL